jgi:carbonic anhydrase
MMSRLLLMVLLLFGAAGDGRAADEHALPHWGYEGEEGTAHWGMRSSAYMACEAGSHQSPINISMPRHAQQQERFP